MVTGANRDVLYLDARYYQPTILQTKLEIPLHKNCILNRECPCLLFIRASLTIEAAFCGTVFFLALFSFLSLFQMLYHYEEQMAALDDVVKIYECYGLKTGTLKGVVEKKPVLWDEKKKLCSSQSREGIPFIGDSFFSVSLYQQLCIHSYEGKSMIPEEGKEAVYVYLAEHGVVYHHDENCVYLNPGITQVSYAEALKKRNRSGARYYACKSCGKKKEHLTSTVVYITPYGDSWHTKKDCPGLKRNIRKVLLSSIGNLPACSKCGKGGR